ncbi:MAG TPA: leukotriene A4 hydrolase C-terminal domain-containing protein, partial [Pyrinomonadaceae bacterium]|nr:leukotriene A4 hydrolase C-terminal domain-containing protein [Pyrinomonadaceae bacterium]
ITATKIPTADWTTQEWLHFLKTVQDEVSTGSVSAADRMVELDKAFHLTRSGNSEIAFQWLLMSIRNRYEPANQRLEEFLTTIGRRKFIKPLYEELAKTPEGKERALAIYRRARPTYHPIAVTTIDDVLKWSGQ